MFEIIFAAVCLAVLVVEAIEVRQKCEESYLGPWHEADACGSGSASLMERRGEPAGGGRRAEVRRRHSR